MKNFKSPLGIIGLLFVVVGVVYTILMFAGKGGYPTTIPFYLIGFGILFLLINLPTKRLPYFKFWQLLIGISPIVAFYGMMYMDKPSEDIFIIPNGYKGKIMVIYGQEDGSKKEFEGDKRIYRIPTNGTLKTQFTIKGSHTSLGEYYYEDDGKVRKKIKTYSSVMPFPDSTAIYVHTHLLGVRTDRDGTTFDYQQATIGSQMDPY